MTNMQEGEVIGEKKYPRDFVQSMFIDSFRQGRLSPRICLIKYNLWH